MGRIFDQGDSSQCVGYAWRALLEAYPLPLRKLLGPTAEQIYRTAQKLDEWDGEEPTYFGTSVRAGAKVVQGGGFLASYVWASDVPTIREFLLTKGPVVVGTTWYSKMYEPDATTGIVTLGGSVEGGHAYVLSGVDTNTKLYRCRNSWGLIGVQAATSSCGKRTLSP
jgi:hypothetical protein